MLCHTYEIVKRRQRLLWTSLLAGLLIMLTGCGSPRGKLYPAFDQPLVWPQPPEKPRIKYLGQFSTQDDLKQEVSSMEALGRLVFGREEIGVLARPHAVAMDDDNKLYIADTSGSVVHVMDLATRNYVQFYKLNNSRRLMSPVALAVVGDRIFAADSILSEICVFDKQGNYLFSFGSDVLRRPSGIAYSKQQQKLYVSDTKLQAVTIFNLNGRYLGQVGEQRAEQQNFNYPTNVWIDKDDKLYVSDTLNYRVKVFSPERTYLFSVGQHGDRPGFFAHPYGLATDSFGNIYVGDKQFENIQIFNPQGQILMAFGNEGNGPGEFWLPAGIFIDRENRIYVADSFNKRIQVFQLLESQIP